MYSTFVLLAGAGVAMAQFTNTTTTPFTTPTSTTTTGLSTPTPSADVLGFRSLGCFNDPEGFPEFELIGSNPLMRLELCAAAAGDANIFAVFNEECWAADSLSSPSAVDVGDAACDIPCPGDEDQTCGGPLSALEAATGLTRRQLSPAVRNLDIYIRVELIAPDTVTVTATETVPTTVTATATSVVTDCPTCEGSGDWSLVIVCVNGLCAPSLPCDTCGHKRVICQGEFCYLEDCTEEEWYKQVECDGENCHYTSCGSDRCHDKVVCYDGVCGKMECYGEECGHDFGCKGDECYHGCEGDCEVIPPCKGEDCGVAPPPVAPPAPEEPIVTPPPVAAASGWSAPAMFLTLIGAGLAFLA